MAGTIITISQHKGGAGKTTLVAHLAVAFKDMKKSVGLIDMDPQQSLSIWHRVRGKAIEEAADGLALSKVDHLALRWEVKKLAADHDVVLIDTPPHAEAETRAAVRAADIVVLPVQPSPMDVWAVMPSLKLAEKAKKPALLVLNRVPYRAKLTDALIPVIKQLEGSLARTRLGNRTVFAGALAEGYGATEFQAKSPAAQEITRLAKEIQRKAK